MKKRNKSKLDIFKVLGEISKGNLSFIDLLSDEESKDFSPYVVLMWLYGAEDMRDQRVVLTNQLVNRILFRTKNDKLIYKLMAIAQGFGHTRYKFIKTGEQFELPFSRKVVMDYYDVNQSVAELYLNVLERTDIIRMMEELGYDQKDYKTLDKEWIKK